MRSYAFNNPTIPDSKLLLLFTMGLTSALNFPVSVLPLSCLIHIQGFNCHVWIASNQMLGVQYRAHSELEPCLKTFFLVPPGIAIETLV